MRMSCNGCRVLRKGCSEDCSLKPCLQWIKSPDAQANATLFLAKFYGRAGLINLINAGSLHLRPAIFRSLLYEAAGRIINPIYGSVGLMWSGNWSRCQAAVEAVLKGAPIMQVPAGDASTDQGHPIMPLQGCDIRHLSKPSSSVAKTRHRVKRSSSQVNCNVGLLAAELMNEAEEKFTITGWEYEDQKDFVDEIQRAPSHDSFSVETVEPTLVNHGKKAKVVNDEIELDLTLGCKPNLQPGLDTVIELSDSEM